MADFELAKESDPEAEETQMLFEYRGRFSYASDDDGASETESGNTLLSPAISQANLETQRPKTVPASSDTGETPILRPQSAHSTTMTKPVASIIGRTALLYNSSGSTNATETTSRGSLKVNSQFKRKTKVMFPAPPLSSHHTPTH